MDGFSRIRPSATPPADHRSCSFRARTRSWQWTRKIAGKTTTVRLTQRQAELLREWIDNGRRLDQLLARLEQLSAKITDRLLKTAAR
jgi:hypothetical protein